MSECMHERRKQVIIARMSHNLFLSLVKKKVDYRHRGHEHKYDSLKILKRIVGSDIPLLPSFASSFLCRNICQIIRIPGASYENGRQNERIIQGSERSDRMFCWGRLLAKSEKLPGKRLIIVVTKKFHFMNGHSMTHRTVPLPCMEQLTGRTNQSLNILPREQTCLGPEGPGNHPDSFPFHAKLNVLNPFLSHIQ